MIGRQVGTYVIEKQIGAGGSGAVYQGCHASLGKRVAIKVLRAELISDEETKARFDREAKVLASMEHPNIVSINDFGLVEGIGPYMVMEWLEGLTLFEARKQRGYLEFAEILNVFEQLGQSLSFMHSKGIVHRDLKPENMMLLAPPGLQQLSINDFTRHRLKLYDFGIALFTQGDEKRLTAMGMVVGTPHYMAPEQIIVDAPVDLRADLYAIGAILYELLTGRPPFWGVKKPVQVMESHLRKKPPLLREVLQREFPDALEKVVARALAKNPAERYQDALQLCQALREAIGSSQPVHLQSPLAGTDRTVVGGSQPPAVAPQPQVMPVQTPQMPEPTDEHEWANTQQFESPAHPNMFSNAAPPASSGASFPQRGGNPFGGQSNPSNAFADPSPFAHNPNVPSATPGQPFAQPSQAVGASTVVDNSVTNPFAGTPFAEHYNNPARLKPTKPKRSLRNWLLTGLAILIGSTAIAIAWFMLKSNS